MAETPTQRGDGAVGRPGGGPAQPVVYVHIPKAAGTSLKAVIAGAYRGLPSLYFTPGDGRLERFAALPAASREACAVVAGHEPFGLQRVFDGTGADPAVLTVLREPVARVESLYRYIFDVPAHARHADFVSRRPTARGVIEAGDFAPFDNHQVRFLAGRGVFEKPVGAVDGGDLALAKRNLEHGVRAFGIQERMGDSLRWFSAALGWTGVSLPRLNTGRTVRSAPELTDADRVAIAEANVFDADLYGFAVSLFEERIAALDDAGGGSR